MIRPTGQTEIQAGNLLLVDFLAPDTEIDALRQRLALEPLPLTGA